MKTLKRIWNFEEHDIQHISWLFKNMIKQFFLMNFHDAKESYYWIKIHLSYDSKKLN